MNDPARRQRALESIRARVGDAGWIDDAERLAPFLREWRGRYHGRAAAVVCPADSAEVAAVVGHCAAAGIGIVPQAGNTGTVGGAAPHTTGDEIILSVRRLDRIREIDLQNGTLTAEAGCILADVQQAARNAGRFFPLSLVSAGTCRIGGNLASNAGGLHTLRYGTMRDLTLGLEVVLADGRLWNGLSKLHKDNSGYELRDLFIGSEGTLGVITAAVLKLYPALRTQVTALLAVAEPRRALEILDALWTATDGRLEAAELIGRQALQLVLDHVPGCRAPFVAPWMLLIEAASAGDDETLEGVVERVLHRASAAGGIGEVVVAAGERQRAALWQLRDRIPEAQRRAGASLKHDIGVPPAAVPELIRRGMALAERAVPGVRPCIFGHLGDGNLHFNLTAPAGGEEAAFLAHGAPLAAALFNLAGELGGTIAAEHGIGQLWRDLLPRYKSPVELDLMRAVKQALDPQGIMNRGKVLPG